jgi:catechol 2,3-dioxygenase-like lactoylglutathione lyase family enzyme
MPDEPFGLHSIGQILVPVEDVDRATAFYRDVLGMRFLYAFPGMAFFDFDGTDLAGRANLAAGLIFTVPMPTQPSRRRRPRRRRNPRTSSAGPDTQYGWASSAIRAATRRRDKVPVCRRQRGERAAATGSVGTASGRRPAGQPSGPRRAAGGKARSAALVKAARS